MDCFEWEGKWVGKLLYLDPFHKVEILQSKLSKTLHNKMGREALTNKKGRQMLHCGRVTTGLRSANTAEVQHEPLQ